MMEQQQEAHAGEICSFAADAGDDGDDDECIDWDDDEREGKNSIRKMMARVSCWAKMRLFPSVPVIFIKSRIWRRWYLSTLFLCVQYCVVLENMATAFFFKTMVVSHDDALHREEYDLGVADETTMEEQL